MTALQLDYRKHLEAQRANLAKEKQASLDLEEKKRSNLASEKQKKRELQVNTVLGVADLSRKTVETVLNIPVQYGKGFKDWTDGMNNIVKILPI